MYTKLINLIDSITDFIGKRTSRRKRSLRQYALTALILSLIIAACNNSTEIVPPNTNTRSNSTELTIWWDKGFNLAEDEALQQIVNNWQQQSGTSTHLSFYTADELPQKAQRALQAGNPPDIMMSIRATQSLNPRLAWQGKLVDVSDVIEPVKQLYPASVLKTVDFYNNANQKRRYYGVPIFQSSLFIFYWRDLIQQTGFRESDIPKDWDAFWKFWQQVQDNLKKQQNQTVYALGFPFSVMSGDTYSLFEQVLEAYNVQLLDAEGHLLIKNPKTRQGIIKSLKWYTQFYQQGYVPPGAEKWLNPDNNINLLNRIVVMTPNSSLSIPASVRQDTDTYQNKLGILGFPNKPNGQPMRYFVAIREAIIFADSKNQKAAKEFLSSLIQPKTMGTYLKAMGGQYLPVMTPVWDDPFWTNPADPHVSTASKILTKVQTRPFYPVYHPAYSLVIQNNIWGRSLNRIVVDRISPEQAADEAIRQIEQIFDQWK